MPIAPAPVPSIIDSMSQSSESEIRNQKSEVERLARRVREFSRRFEFGDALLVFYFVVLVRQWFWPLENTAGWSLTVTLALAVWCFYVSTKREATGHISKSFWLVVALPLLLVYLLR